MMETQKGLINTNGIHIHVVQSGPSRGALVILLHGFPEFWRGWIHQIPPLAEAGYRLWVPDQRGYNLSDKPKGAAAYHIDILAQDVIGLIQAAGEEKAILIGHDWGAAVAWHLATRYPDIVDRLVVLNVPHLAVMLRTLRRSTSQLRKSWYMFFFQFPWLPEWVLGRNKAHALGEMLRRTANPGTFTEVDIAHYQEAWCQPGALTAMINWYRSAIRSGFTGIFKGRTDLPSITVPTLLIWGKRDVALDSGMAQASIDLCQDGRLVFFEQATHWVQHDEAQQVNQLLLAFLGDSL